MSIIGEKLNVIPMTFMKNQFIVFSSVNFHNFFLTPTK